MSRNRLGWLLVSAAVFAVFLYGTRLTVSANALLKVADLGEGRVLTACAQEVAQGVDLDTAVTALVEESESLLVVCCVGLIHCLSLFDLLYCAVEVWLSLQGKEVCGEEGGMAGLLLLCCSKDGAVQQQQGDWRVLVGCHVDFRLFHACGLGHHPAVTQIRLTIFWVVCCVTSFLDGMETATKLRIEGI
jgi:hypothetical protein